MSAMEPRTVESAPASQAPKQSDRGGRPRRAGGWPGLLGLDRFSGLYVFALVILIFSLWVPNTFLRTANVELIANQQAITALLALAVIVPMAAGQFDLSFAAIMGQSTVTVAFLETHGWNVAVTIVVGVALGALLGGVNGFFVARLGVSSFVTTLAPSSILAGTSYWVTNGFPITSGISPALLNISDIQFLGVSLVFYIMITVAAILYVILEYTPAGRYLFAVGGNPDAARLAGLPVGKINFYSLVASGTISGFA